MIDLDSISGVCPIHDNYDYNVKKNEESVGCPVCTVKEQKEEIQRLETELMMIR
jgi:hypothetical protein